MKAIRFASVMLVVIQLVAGIGTLVPIFSGEASATIGTLTTFTNGNAVQVLTFPEKGEEWGLALKLPANSTVTNATLKVTGSFLGGTARISHTNDSPQGWGGEMNNQPESNNTTSADGGESLILYLSQLGPLKARVDYTAGSNPSGIAIGDINSDGKDEVVVTNLGNNNMSIYNGTPDGRLNYLMSYSTDNSPWDVDIGDVSGDDLNDVVVCCGNSQTCYISVFTQNSDGTLNTKTSYQASSGSSRTYFLDIGDVNSDNYNDVVTVDQGGSMLKVFIQNSTTGLLNSATNYSIAVYSSGVAIGNCVNAHPGNEVAVYMEPTPYYYYYVDPTLRVYEQNSGSLTQHTQYTFSTYVYKYGSQGKPYPVEIGDISGDGRADIVLGWQDSSSNYLSVFCQTTLGDISSRIDYTNGVTSPRAIALGDVNNDGKTDLVLANDGSNNFALMNYTANGRLTNMKTYSTSTKPTGIAIGDINDDGRNDVATACYSAGVVSAFIQPAWFNGSFLSKSITAPKPNEYAKIYTARPYWNITNNGEQSTVFLSNDDGKTWTNVTNAKGQWLNFTTGGTKMRYLIYMNSTRSAVTPKLLDISIDYTYGTDPKGLLLDIGAEGEYFEYTHDPFLNGSEWVRDFSPTLNEYLIIHEGEKDAQGFITIPIYFQCGGMGRVTFSDLLVLYDRPPNIPQLLSPYDGTYIGNTPTLKVTCHDPDDDTLLYMIEISENSSFNRIMRTLDMRQSTLGWTKANYSSDEAGVYITPANQSFTSGKTIYWRVWAYDESLYKQSGLSKAGFFHIDSEAPTVSASSPQYSKSNSFEVTWSGEDPIPGSGLLERPYDVQYKVDDGEWTDWQTATSGTKAEFTGEPGHTYYFRARATDVAGNRKIYSGGNGDTSTIIDPNPPVSAAKKLAEYTTSSSFMVEWSGTDGVGGSGVAGYDVQYKVDGGGQTWTDLLTSTTRTTATFDGIQGQTYYFQVRAKDRAGNVEDWPGGTGDAGTKVDITPPAGVVEDEGAETQSAVGLSAKLLFSDGESGVVTYEYRVGTAAGASDVVAPTVSHESEINITNLTLMVGGTYYIGGRAKNGAGLWGGWASSDGITVSTRSIRATLSYQGGVQNELRMVVTLGGETGGPRISDGDLEVRRASYYLGDIGTWSNWMEVGTDKSDLGTVLYEGERGYAYEYRYRIKSELGIWSMFTEPGTRVRINAPPVAVMGTSVSVEVGKAVMLDGTRSWDPDGDSISNYQWDFGDGKKAETAAAKHGYGRPGTYTVNLTVGDGSLNTTGSISVMVRAEEVATPGFEGWLMGAALLAAGLVSVWRKRR